MTRARTVLLVVPLAVMTALSCSHGARVVAPEVAQPVAATPLPDASAAAGASATTVRPEAGVVAASRPESGVSGSDLPADIEAINKAGYLKDAFFDTNLSDLGADTRDTLSADARWLAAHPTVRISIEGHCDERNTAEYNLALGWRRANAVKDYLVSLGVAATRMTTISYGEERPFAEGHNEDAWKQNRRAHLVVTAR